MSIFDRLELIIAGLGFAIRALITFLVPTPKFSLIYAIMTVDLIALAAFSWLIDYAFAYKAFESTGQLFIAFSDFHAIESLLNHLICGWIGLQLIPQICLLLLEIILHENL